MTTKRIISPCLQRSALAHYCQPVPVANERTNNNQRRVVVVDVFGFLFGCNFCRPETFHCREPCCICSSLSLNAKCTTITARHALVGARVGAYVLGSFKDKGVDAQMLASPACLVRGMRPQASAPVERAFTSVEIRLYGCALITANEHIARCDDFQRLCCEASGGQSAFCVCVFGFVVSLRN